MQPKPRSKKKTSLIEPTRVFIVLLAVAVVFFLPIVAPGDEERGSFAETYPALNPLASSADACPWNCIQCTSWDEDAWPKNCLTYECTDASGECGEDDGGGGGGPQPPSITAILNCANNGLNGWCIGALTLDLTAFDPQGQSVIISGDVNGNIFTCVENPCSISLPEGTGSANYKADSTTGLSASGSTIWQLDVTTPQIVGNTSGSSGASGWYVTQAVASAAADDSLSGIASFEATVDGGPWTAVSAPITFTDGIHTIQYRATDNAGNITETTAQSVNVDTVAPVLNVVVTGTPGASNWYISAVTLAPTASDPSTGSGQASGLAILEATTDGATWFPVNAPVTLTDGMYTVQFRAVDNAGNISQTTAQEIKVDATTPSLSLSVNGTRGQNDWYVSSVLVGAITSDATSGIALVEAKVDSDQWTVISDRLPVFTDGVHTYQVKATDNAGNVTETPVLTLMVDTVPPAIAMDVDSLSLGDALYYDLEDSLSGLWINRAVIEDDDEKYKKLVWVEELTGAKSNNNEIRWDGIFPSTSLGTSSDGTKAAPGVYFITLKISDQAGNETMRTAVVEVTAFNALLPIPVFIPPTSVGTSNELPSPQPAPEANFGGTTNDIPVEQPVTTTTGGESVFRGVSVQAGFSAGNQSTNLPIANPNILWGAAAAALLGSTLAEWQRQREEEAKRLAALRNSGGGGGGDEDEMPSDVLAKRRAKVIAKNEAKRAKEHLWEAARQAKAAQKDEETFMRRTYKKIVDAANVIPSRPKNMVNPATQSSASRARIHLSPPTDPLTPFIGLITPYERQIAWERYRIGEQYPNLSLGDTAALIAQRKYKHNDSNYFQFGYGDFPGSNCSNFVSQVWWAAGVRLPGSTWVAAPLQKIDGNFPFATLEPLQQRAELQELVRPWFGTPQQQALFSAYNGEFRIAYNGDPSLMKPLRDSASFNQIITKYPQVFPSGGAVFYNDGSWAHSAILTNPSAPSTSLYYDGASTASVNRPVIVEHDGKFDYLLDEEKKPLLDTDYNPIRDPNPVREIRSLDDTNSSNIYQVSIVPITPINLEAYGFDVSQMSPVIVDGSAASCYTIEQGSQSDYSLQVCLPTIQP